MRFKFYGQSCFEVYFGGKTLLFDPFISGNDLAKDIIDIDSLKPDYILISHAHGDHIIDAERIAKNSGAIIISNFEIVSWYGKQNIKGHPMNHGGKWNFDFGTVKYVNAVHSSVMLDGSSGGNAGGFVIWDDTYCFYYAGDTALTFDMKLIPITCPKLDFAVLPIGDNFTMGYEDASIAAEWIETKKVIACHFDTFGFIKIDHEAAKASFNQKGIDVILPEINQEINF